MFDAVNGSVANQTSLSHPANYNYSNHQFSGSGSGLTSTNNPLLTSYSGPSSPSIYSNASSSTTTRVGNKKQSKNGGNTSGAGGGGFQDQNAIRRGFNGTENYNNGFGGGGGSGRNKEGRQKNNRKQISSVGGGAAQNADEGAEWSYDSGNYSEPKYYLGKLIQGTYCSRVFSDCERRACRMQSPNYPGVYPRNLTCFYAVRQVSVAV